MNKIITVYELLGLIKDGKAPDHQLSLFNKYRVEYCLNDKLEIIDDYKQLKKLCFKVNEESIIICE